MINTDLLPVAQLHLQPYPHLLNSWKQFLISFHRKLIQANISKGTKQMKNHKHLKQHFMLSCYGDFGFKKSSVDILIY